MSDERLTVSELLARSGQPGEAAARRRRRSVEEGGVSVAELTGSIPRVKARPATSKHHTGSWSADEVREASQAAANAPQTKQPQQAKQPHTATASGAKVVAPGAAKSTQQVPNPKNEGAAAAQPGQQAQVIARPEKSQGAKSATKVAKPGESGTTGSTTAAVGQKPSDDETIVLQVVDERDPIRLTTGEFPSVTATVTGSFRIPDATQRQAAPQATPAAATQASGSRIAQAAQPQQRAGAGAAAPTAAPQQAATPQQTAAPQQSAPPQPSALQNQSQMSGPQAAQAPTGAPAAASLSGLEGTAAPGQPARSGEPTAAAFADTEEPAPAYFDDEELEEVTPGSHQESASLNMVSVILMSLVGIAFGVAILIGFEEVWERFSTAIAAVSALAVTAVIVWSVSRFKTDHNKRSTILAGIAGLVLTFGPMLLV